MYCRKCGEKIEDDASFCMFCGSSTKEETQVVYVNPKNEEPRVFAGVLAAMVFGVLGLIVGMFMYPNGSYARKSFTNAWLTTVIVKIAIEVVLSVIIYITYGEFMLMEYLSY